MPEEEKKKLLNDLREFSKRAKSSTKKEAIKFLYKTGMYTHTGKLKAEFR